MIRVSPSRLCLSFATMCALICIGWATTASAQPSGQMTLPQLIDKSDAIFVGTCVGKQAVVQKRMIVTKYRIKPSEVWKGQPARNAKGEVEMEEVGGQLDGPVPIATAVNGMANIASGEEVLLFTAMPKMSAARGAKMVVAANKPYILGRSEGRYTVFAHPESGARLVAKANLSKVPGAPVKPSLLNLMMQQSPQAKAAATAKVAPGVLAARQKQSQTLARIINDTTAKAKIAQATARRDKKNEAERIYQFESLGEVKADVLRMMKAKKL